MELDRTLQDQRFTVAAANVKVVISRADGLKHPYVFAVLEDEKVIHVGKLKGNSDMPETAETTKEEELFKKLEAIITAAPWEKRYVSICTLNDTSGYARRFKHKRIVVCVGGDKAADVARGIIFFAERTV